MSSILEALKKLEDEKAARQSNGGQIVGKVVKPGRKTKQQPKWILPVGMAVVASLAVLVTYLIMGGKAITIETMQSTPTLPHDQASSPPQRYLAPPQPQQSVAPPVMPTPVPSPPPPSLRKVTVPRPPAPARVNEAPVANSSAPKSQVVAAPAERNTPPPDPEAKPVLPSLKVTGIGWQKGNADRLAIVNGRAVSEGAVVEGARVEEIFPDRVRFSFNDKTFEISLGKIVGE